MRATLQPFSQLAAALKKGMYEHYSGKRYQVLGVGRDSETLKEVVVYQAQEGGDIWVRPLEMFCETVEIDGVNKPRFRFLFNQ